MSVIRRSFVILLGTIVFTALLGGVPSEHTGQHAEAAKVKTSQAKRLKAMKVALAQRGDPYRYGASGPNAFDCSGLVAYAYGRVGKRVPHSSAALSRLRRVSLKALQVGDVVGRPGHVGIYIGGGKMVHAASPGRGVRVDPIGRMRWAVRP